MFYKTAPFRVLAAIGLFLMAGLCPVFGVNEKVLPENLPAAVSKMTPLGRMPATNKLHLTIGLELRNPAGLDQFLAELYDPASPNYRKYLTPEELIARFSPTEAEYSAVKDFARTNGLTIRGTYGNRLLLDVTAKASDVERAFHIKLNLYKHPTEPRDFFAPDTAPTINAALPITDVQGLSDYFRLHPKFHKSDPSFFHKGGSAPDGSGAYFGDDFRHAYAPGTVLTGAGQQVGLVQFDGFYSNDIAAYATAAGGGRTNIVIQTVLLDGFSGTPTTGQNSGEPEVALDIEMSMAMAPGLSKIVVFEAPNSTAYFNDILNAMLASNQVKNLSCSWGGGGPNSTSENIFKLMAAQGQSFFNASGDSCAFTGSVPFPSESTNIVQVGATTLTTGSGASYISERVWNWGETISSALYDGVGSSGGISTTYSLPSWQQGISMTANHGSTTKRNIPDVALTGDNVYVIHGGSGAGSGGWGGTSCAAPLWAGFTALINQQAALAAKPSVGFLNPALYGIGKGSNYNTCFHDTASGDNFWSKSPTNFPGVAGYDLCTGWGTPNGTNLINALVPLVYAPSIVGGNWTLLSESATPVNGRIDPGETVTVDFTLKNQGLLATSNLVATLEANSGVLEPTGPQSYGALAALGGAASKTFTFTATGDCGSNVVASLQLQDGTNDLGTVNFILPLGSPTVVGENFDGVAVPSLPVGWANANVTGTTANWITTNDSSDTPPNSAFITDSANSGENALVSPPIAIGSANAQLSFRQNYSLEYVISGHGHNQTTEYHDGGVLEIQIGNGAFTDILTAGGSFVSGGYNHTITTTSDNPLGGRSAWGGSSSGWTAVTVDLPAAAAGQTIRLRWNCATDTGNSGNGAVGWHVDSVSVSGVAPDCLSVFTDVAASQSLAASSLTAGHNLVYTLSVTNLGPQAAANVVVTDTVPANATFVSASPGCSYSSGQVLCPAGMLAVNASTNFTVTFAPAGGNTFTNVVSVGTVTPDFNSANNSSTLVATQTGGTGGIPASIVSGPADQTIQCGGDAAFSITVTGTPPLSVQWSLDSAPVPAATNLTFTATNLHTPDHFISVSVTNLYGGATSNAVVTVMDTLAPVITLNGANPLYVELGGTFSDPGATAYDACEGVVPVSASGTVNTSVVGTNTLSYVASDGNGNSATNTRTVIVRDTTPPTIVWSFTNLVLAVGTNAGTAMPDVTGTNYIVATDLSGSVVITQNPTNNAFLPLGTNSVLLTAADGSGNSAVSTNTITVVVSTNATPQISSPTIQGSGVVLQLSGAYGSTYVLEAATNLTSGAWQPLATNTIGVDGDWQFTDSSVTNHSARFYRLKLVQ